MMVVLSVSLFAKEVLVSDDQCYMCALSGCAVHTNHFDVYGRFVPNLA